MTTESGSTENGDPTESGMAENRVTEILLAFEGGNRAVLDELVPFVYEELRAIASRKLSHERQGHTLNTTALVHEAYLKLVRLGRIQWQSRAHFLAIAGQTMRNILVSHAIHRKRIKRGKGTPHLPLHDVDALAESEADEILAFDAALEKLSQVNHRQARIVECRFFAGMTIEDTACVLEISPATVKRDWTLLRAWLRRELER
jgi:RNA polymerase sigma factor (TIGR02999 family)